MFRQNAVLNDFVNFLKTWGRFREIEFIDNSVHATPRIPGFPSLVFYMEENRSEQHYTLEIHGDESTVMNREIQEFFQLNQLNLKKIRIKYSIKVETDETIIVETEGIGSAFEALTDRILDVFESYQYSITTIQKTQVFSPDEADSSEKELVSRQTIKPSTRIQPITPKISPIISQEKRLEDKKTPSYREEPLSTQYETPVIEYQDQPNEEVLFQKDKSIDTDFSTPSVIKSKGLDLKEEYSDLPQEDNKLFTMEMSNEDLEKDLFHPKPPLKDYSSNIKPYIKQTSSLFRRDNWEEDLPTEVEMEILERTYMRIKHRTKPEILAKDLNMPIDEAESSLRSLIEKGLLRTQVGWYIIKKSHLPFFKKTFSDGNKKKKKKKSPRISRVGEGLTPEEIATIKAIKARPNLKAQSNLLTRPTGLKQSVLKEVLRNLVEKGILRVSYGWYILKDKHILEHKRGSSLDQVKEPKQYEIPKGLDLTQSEEKVIQALLQRSHYKAQSNLLTPDLKLPKEQIKQVLRELVEKGICNVKFGWYCLKNPEKFQRS